MGNIKLSKCRKQPDHPVCYPSDQLITIIFQIYAIFNAVIERFKYLYIPEKLRY